MVVVVAKMWQEGHKVREWELEVGAARMPHAGAV